MRLTMLLDSYSRGNLDPQQNVHTGGVPSASVPVAPKQDVNSTYGASNAAFDQLLDGLLPCRVEDAELWFAERASDVEQAKTLCQQCPLRAGCLQGALDRSEPWGVWGGEVFVDGRVVAAKRGRGRPRKVQE